MIKLSQRDSRWSQITLIPSKLTMGRYGCTTTCISMLSDYFQCYANPAQIPDNYVKYTLDGLVIWSSINFKNFKFQERLRTFQQAKIDESLRHPDKAVILEVANGSHWVVAIRKIPGSKHYLIVDPWDGKIKSTLAYKNITGSAHFIEK